MKMNEEAIKWLKKNSTSEPNLTCHSCGWENVLQIICSTSAGLYSLNLGKLCWFHLVSVRAEKEFAVMSHQLKSDLDEKSSLIKQLSSQLDTHQANFNELKQELNKVRLYVEISSPQLNIRVNRARFTIHSEFC